VSSTSRIPKILLIDSNVYFSKRLADALKKEGFQVLASTQPAFALTTLEYDTPTAVVCATNMREMGALELANIIRADPKNATLPIIALGDGSQRALMEAFQAGCDDYIDRQRQPAVIATHIRNIIISKSEGFQPTQMLAQADTSLSGSLTHHDLPGVLQMLGQARQTGALHINAGATDAVLFFDAGNINHAECGSLFGDEAVIHIVKSCIRGDGVYKFVYGATTPRTTVLRSATDLMLDAMREYDESSLDAPDRSHSLQPILEELLTASPVASEAQQQPAEQTPSSDASSFQEDSAPVVSEPQTEPAEAAQSSNGEPQLEISEQSEHIDPAPSSPEAPQSDAAPSEFDIAPIEEDAVTGYTETAPSSNDENSETAIVVAHEEEISLLEKILMELASRHIVEEQHPADLADKEAQ
jgi:CheY-like chemotaxis protein